MWKNISVACGVVALVLGLSYGLYVIRERHMSHTQTSDETSAVRKTKARPGLTGSTADSMKGAAPMSKPTGQGDRLAGTGDEKELDAFLARAELLESLARKSEGGEGQSQEDSLKPVSSKDIPPENGAHYFLLAAELFPEVDRDWVYAKWDEIHANGWSDDPQLLALFEACQNSIDTIRKGLAVGNAQMPDPRSLSEPMPYLSTFRVLARVMALEAMKQTAEGNVAAAFDTYITALDFARESSHASGIINGFIGMSIDTTVLLSLRSTLDIATASPSDYRFLIEQMCTLDAATHPLSENAVREAQFMRSLLETQPSAANDFRTTLFPAAGNEELRTRLANMSGEELKSLLRNAVAYNERVAYYLTMPYYNARMVDVDAVVRDNPLIREFFPPIMYFHEALTKDSAGLRGTTIMAGIELYRTEHGSYPASLDSLAPNYLPTLPEDPFTGKPFLYRPTETGYLLYSAGADMDDNGGTTLDRWNAEGADVVLHPE